MRPTLGRWAGASAAVTAALWTMASCATDTMPPGDAPVTMGGDPPCPRAQPAEGPVEATGVTPWDAAGQRIAELRARFVVVAPAPPPAQGALRSHPEAAPRPVIGPGVVSAFEADGDVVHAQVPSAARRGVRRAASVALPAKASGAVRLEDEVSHVSIAFALRGASDVPVATTAEGMALYTGALGGHDVVHRVHAEGTEDFVVFESRPEREELVYDVDVSRVPGLRLVSNVLEFLDANGTPALRVASPYVVGADGRRREARVLVDGCSFDTNPTAPWGRRVTPPGSPRCGVRVAWQATSYPALVDPAWVATGSMTHPRYGHTATLLPAGTVLIAGGDDRLGVLATAELYDGTSAFAATGSMSTARLWHSATLLPTGKVLVAGGNTASAELFDGAGAFAPTGSMTLLRSNHTATLLPSGKVLIAGGNPGPATAAELFDGTSAFVPTGSMSQGRVYHTATLLNTGKVLVAGGRYSAGGYDTSSAELFDPTGAGSFTSAGSMTTVRAYHAAALLASGKVLLAGGEAQYVGNALTAAEVYDPTALTFTATGSMVVGRVLHSATVIAGGKVLVAGGSVTTANFGTFASAELYDPGAGGFAATGSMATDRIWHTATRLASGKVLVAGGSQDTSFTTATASAEVLGLDLGQPCASAADCITGFCADGVCCDTACSAATGEFCAACSAALKASGPDGTCGPAKDDTNPHSDNCPVDPGYPDDCKADGKCDGNGACRAFAMQGTKCGNATCSGQTLTGQVCNAGGVCVPGTASCGLFLCNTAGTACNSMCAVDTDCALDAYCDTATGTCAIKGTNATPCSSGTACNSGYCFDGVCCNQGCSGICEACNIAPNKGSCLPITGDPTMYGHAACPGAGSACGGSCDGADTNECHFAGAGTPCGAMASCSGDVSTAAQACDGTGTCAPATTKSCTPYGCDAASGACKQTCTSIADCAQGATCDTATGNCAAASGTCVDPFTVMDPDGQATSCSPYRCDNGACASHCASAADCASGYTCDAGGMCVGGSGTGGGGTGTPGKHSGCGCKTAGDPDSGAPLALLVPALLAAYGRRRRPSP